MLLSRSELPILECGTLVRHVHGRYYTSPAAILDVGFPRWENMVLLRHSFYILSEVFLNRQLPKLDSNNF